MFPQLAPDSIDLSFDVKDREIDQSIVFHRNIGWERLSAHDIVMTVSRNDHPFYNTFADLHAPKQDDKQIIVGKNTAKYLLATNAQFQRCICGRKIGTLDSRPQRPPPCLTCPSPSLVISSRNVVITVELVRLCSARFDLSRLDSSRLVSARFGSAWLGLARLGSACLGLARLVSARLVLAYFDST